MPVIHSYHRGGRLCKLGLVIRINARNLAARYFCYFRYFSYFRHPAIQGEKSRTLILPKAPVVSIVDDDQAVRRALGSLVRSMGWEARLFESAEAFLASGEAADTTCLISDIRMSGISGVEMHERLIAQGYAPATIFISAYPTPSLQAKALSNGALVLLQKPYQASVMSHWLSTALGAP
jgi:CheY-like chemotaxis protein